MHYNAPPANVSQVSQITQISSRGHAASGSGPRLQGPWLLLARAVWLACFVAILIQFVVLLPRYLSNFEAICPQNCFFTRATRETFTSSGLTPATLAWGTLVLYLIIVLVSSTMAAILFWRRSEEWMVLLVAYFLVAYPISNLAVAVSPAFANSLVLIALVEIPAITVFYAVFLVFPSGRFVPRWSWILLLIWVVAITAGTIWPSSPYVAAYPICYGGAILCQVYRYRRVSTPVQRQQTKWVIFGFIASLLANQAFWLVPGSLVSALYRPIFFLVYQLLLLFVPITFYIAIQRHRLYDIDVIINRTLVYGSLSAILAAVYIGGILGLQSLFALITGQGGQEQSPLAIVISTLVIAALFQPLRHRLQQVIDHRFYRRKYDAEKALAAFSATLRSEVELASLEHQLVAIIEETMQPSSVSLWLRGSATSKPPEGAAHGTLYTGIPPSV